MLFAYNVEINAVTIILAIILEIAIYRSSNTLSNERLVMHFMLLCNVIFSFSDIFTVGLKGTEYAWSYWVLQISNIINFASLTALSYMWVLFVFARVEKNLTIRQKWLLAIPLIIFVVTLLTTPWTNFVYIIDEYNRYTRNFGIYLHWAVTWCYMIFGSMVAGYYYRKETNQVKQWKIRPLLWYMFFPMIAAIVQMLYYGISLIQMGTIIGLVLIHAITMADEINIDALTGLNNRASLNTYLADMTMLSGEQNYCMLMSDLNDFKQINDKFGHNIGDQALKDAAAILKQVCATLPRRVFLARYGGDEFVIIGRNVSEEEFSHIPADIAEKSTAQNNLIAQRAKEKNSAEIYTISFSVGIAYGKCNTYEEAEDLLDLADNRMYEEKKRMKAGR